MNILADPKLLQEVRRYGRFDANACLNCGSCSVVCELSTDNAPFPRRPIRRVLLGLKKEVKGSLEPWLCHDCGDCTRACPREADPRESMATLRRYLTAQYDLTRLTGKVLRSRLWEITALIVAGLMVFGLVLLYHLYHVELEAADFISMPMGLEHMFDTIIYFTIAVYAIPLVILLLNVAHMHRLTMRRNGTLRPRVHHYLLELWRIAVHLVSQPRMKKCPRPAFKRRWGRHWAIVLSFAIISVILLFFLSWFQTDAIYPLSHPQRWIGYLVTVGLIAGSVDVLVRRLRKGDEIHTSSVLGDWVLPVLLLLTAVSGIAVHIFRYLEFPLTTHFLYAVHLAIAVPMLIVELPFGKLSHMMYRPLALYFEAVRERALAEEDSHGERNNKETVAA